MQFRVFVPFSYLFSAAMNIILLNQNSEIQNEIQLSAWAKTVLWDDIEHWLAFHYRLKMLVELYKYWSHTNNNIGIICPPSTIHNLTYYKIVNTKPKPDKFCVDLYVDLAFMSHYLLINNSPVSLCFEFDFFLHYLLTPIFHWTFFSSILFSWYLLFTIAR